MPFVPFEMYQDKSEGEGAHEISAVEIDEAVLGQFDLTVSLTITVLTDVPEREKTIVVQLELPRFPVDVELLGIILLDERSHLSGDLRDETNEDRILRAESFEDGAEFRFFHILSSCDSSTDHSYNLRICKQGRLFKT